MPPIYFDIWGAASPYHSSQLIFSWSPGFHPRGRGFDLPRAVCDLAFTRYSLTSRLLCTNQPSFHPLPSTCIAHPGAILLHDYQTVYDSPSDLPSVCYTPHNIGNYNIL